MIAQLNDLYIKFSKRRTYSRLISYFMFEGRPLTTKGQWINPIIKTLHNFFKYLPLKKVDAPIYIIGTGRSGTTILGVIMSMHKQIGFLNEPKIIWNSINPNEDVIGSYSKKQASFILDESHASKKQSRSLNRIYNSYLKFSLNSRVLDKYPELVFRVPYVLKLVPDAKFLFLVRNGNDTCNSIDLWSKRLGKQNENEIHDWWGRDNRKWILLKDQIIKQDPDYSSLLPIIDQVNNHKEMAAIEWIVSMNYGLKFEKLYPNSIYRVKYENLTKDPVKELNNIFSFCELESDQRTTEYGSSILKENPAKSDFTMHEEVKNLFIETNKKLGY
ncbi:sulfotransferase [Flammeovirga sp. EKP202]|uniref:sulfotransferase family protein n=1 Tax=Flammeovirga sp. EKP202 TaxID=2770592 RepID=UPI00165F6D39|nr:sulfotransferase [Flammeovirga sp. EKP202]MBD0404488.1 sulfotransferase [Flammeovirga sp. EKP202]